MLRKLQDFPSGLETIRRIPSLDLDQVFDYARLQQLEQSFLKVVTLNAVIAAHSRYRME
ncbi:hypothetical protein NZK33_16650 [Cyanobium sp. FGCU-6]|jgi:hypothetical protein|nr:hypothetical protein [Cyanobium sp. FGCU6]